MKFIKSDPFEMLFVKKGNHVEREREKAARGEARLGIISKAHQEKIETLDEKANKVCKDIRDRKMENMKLVSACHRLFGSSG